MRRKTMTYAVLGAIAVAAAGGLLVARSYSTTETTVGRLGKEKPPATLYKNPQCSCCEDYASYLRSHGYAITVRPIHDLPLIRRRHGVSETLAGCHTTLIGGYVVEGHVPVGTLNKLLNERPNIKGISLPGMPAGSPGMTGIKRAPFEIYEITDGPTKVFATE